VIASKAGYVLPAQRRIVARFKPLVRPLIGFLGLGRHHLPGVVRGSPAQNFSPAYLRRAVEGSLRRLGTDRLDLFQLHSPPTAVVELGEWVESLDGLKRAGKIRYYGISCDSIEAALAALDHPGVSSIQVAISLLERGAIDTVLPRARDQGVAVIARECLANGLLAKDASAIDLRTCCPSAADVERKAGQLESYRRTAVENGCTLAQLALQFVGRLEGVSVSLVGMSRPQQLDAFPFAGGPSAQRHELRGIPHFG
jgi:aryl-alcohol dehydrogenase-like predicted oxidoreductase